MILAFGLTACFAYLPCIIGCSKKNFNATYITCTNIQPVENDITLFSNTEEISAYLKQDRFGKASDEFISQMNKYTSLFFELNMLAVINVTEISSSNTLTVNKISFNDTQAQIIITRKSKSVSDDSIKGWSIFVEFEIQQQIESVTYVITG